MKQILRSLFLLLLAVVWGGEVLAATGDKFTLVTSESDLKAGDVIIIANISAKKALGTTQNTSNRSAENITITGTTATTSANVQEITLEGESGAWYFNVGTLGYLYAASSSGNQLKSHTTKDDNSKATITFSSQTATIKFQGNNTRNTIKYNSSSTIFACYSSGQQAVSIYKKTSNLTATTLTFPNDEINIEEGNEASFAAQTATLKAGEETLTGKTITYATTGADIFATFETTTGAATLKTGSYGKATITASFAGDDTYAASSKSYIVNYTEKQKTATTLAFVDAPTGVKNIGDEFQLHTSLTAGDATIDGDVTYDSSDKTVATIDADGNVKALAKGKTTITATFAGNDTYAKSEASFLLNVIDPNVIDPVTFDFSDYERYGKTAQTSGNTAYPNGPGDVQVGESISEGIVTLTNVAQGTSNGTRFWTGGEFRVYKNAKHTVSVPKGYVITEISISGEAKKCLYKIGKNTDNSDWTGSARSVDINYNGNSVLYSMTVTYEKLNASTITLSETDADVATTIADNDGKTVNVKLQRTLKAGIWNTICLPFAVDADDVKNVLKAEGNVKEYESEDEATATINFKDATTLEAGVPYLIKPTEAATELDFEFVTIKNVDAADCMVGDKYNIIGTFAPYAMETKGTELFLGSDGKFYVPGEGKNTMNGFRAYFLVPNGTSAANVNINFGGATGISGVATDAVKNVKVYNVNGQYVGTSLEALPKGLYIVGGKKVLK